MTFLKTWQIVFESKVSILYMWLLTHITTVQLHSTKVWIQVLRMFKSCSWHVGDSWCWGSLTVVPAGNKAMHLLLVNHTKNTIHHHHHHHHHHHRPMVEPVMIKSDEYQEMWNFIVFLDLPSSTREFLWYFVNVIKWLIVLQYVGANNADLDKFKVNSWVFKYWATFSGVTSTAEVAYSLNLYYLW